MSEELDDILNGEEDAPIEPLKLEPEPEDTQPEVVESKEDGPKRDEKGRFAPKGEEKAEEVEDAPPASKEEPADVGLKAGIAAERRKRQELERKLEELQAQSKPEEPAPDMFEDPDAWQGHFSNNLVSQAVQQATTNATLNMSEMMARQSHDDFDAMKDSFLKMAEENPAVRNQALSDPHPWERAYQIAKNAATMQELGATNLDDLRASIRKQLEEEMAAQEKPAPNIPKPLAGEQNATGGGTTDRLNEDLNSILGNKF